MMYLASHVDDVLVSYSSDLIKDKFDSEIRADPCIGVSEFSHGIGGYKSREATTGDEGIRGQRIVLGTRAYGGNE